MKIIKPTAYDIEFEPNEIEAIRNVRALIVKITTEMEQNNLDYLENSANSLDYLSFEDLNNIYAQLETLINCDKIY